MPDIALPNGFVPRELGQKTAMRYFDSGGLRGVYCWPRRYGKDLTFAHQTCKAMHERTGMYLHMLPNHKQARKVIWDGFDNEGKRIIDTVFPPEIRESKNETEMKIVLKCGSLWQLVGSDYYDSIVGANPIGFVMSEAALSDPRAWNYFRPMLAGNGGWASFISTPRGRNWFHSLLQHAKSDPMWDWSHLTAYDTQHIPAHVLEDERREMPDELFRQEYLCDFSAANIGAIFGRYMEQAEREGRIVESLPPDLTADVRISSDIGYRDKAAFIWWRIMRGGFEIIDYDEGTGLDAEEWIERLRGKPRANVLYLPHDAKVKTFQSRHSVVEQFLKANIAEEVRVNVQRKKKDSINAGRRALRSVRIDASKCGPLIEALHSYHFKYDEEQKVFSSEPDHDWSSHAADALMEGAAALEDYVAPPAPPKPFEQLAQPMHNAWALEDLWQSCGPSAGSRRV